MSHGTDFHSYNVPAVIRVLALDEADARATVNAFLQRGDGELDDGTAIVAWRFPVSPVIVPDADAAGLGGDMKVPGIPDGETGRNEQKDGTGGGA